MDALQALLYLIAALCALNGVAVLLLWRRATRDAERTAAALDGLPVIDGPDVQPAGLGGSGPSRSR